MRGFKTSVQVMIALGGMLAAGAVVAAEADRSMQALSRLEPGLWQIRQLDSDRARPRSICLGDAAVLIQLEHRQIVCSRLVITNEPQKLTVHYVCPYNGFGQTSLRVENPQHVTLDTQGIANNAPFAYRADLRRLGACAPQTRAAR
jgi:hypothetical protein